MKKISPACGKCTVKSCKDGKDCFALADSHKKLYENEELIAMHRAAAAAEGRHYNKETRLYETIFFAKEMGIEKIGLAFCVGLSQEAEALNAILSRHFKVISVCCKICGINKKQLNLEQINQEKDEVMCNPAGQAELMNNAGTELNIICGLCVGHDAIFTKMSKAPVTTLIAKDRVLAHNPAAAVYCNYVKKRFTDNIAG